MGELRVKELSLDRWSILLKVSNGCVSERGLGPRPV